MIESIKEVFNLKFVQLNAFESQTKKTIGRMGF